MTTTADSFPEIDNNSTMNPISKVLSLTAVLIIALSCSYNTYYYAYTEVDSSEAATAASFAARGERGPATEVVGVYVKDNAPVYVLKTNMRKEDSFGPQKTSATENHVSYNKAPVKPLYGNASKVDFNDVSSRLRTNSFVEPISLANYGQRLIEMYASQDPSLRKDAKRYFKFYRNYIKAHNVEEVYHYIDDINRLGK